MSNLKKIYLAPLQGYTNADYRNLHFKYFGGIDKYYSPYLRFEPNKDLKRSVLKDLDAELNKNINFVPQILGSDIPLFIELANRVDAWGYSELNWNLGCPYPMVTKRGFGSALLNKPDQIRRILDAVFSQIKIPLSIKCRLGFDNSDEIYKLLSVFNDYDIKELTVHTRTAKQMYKGQANPNAFIDIINTSKNTLVYNGDLRSVDDIKGLDVLFNNKIDTYMIGRGILMNPFLASEIKQIYFTRDEKREILRNFHAELLEYNKEKLEPSHLLGRMVGHWEYLSFSFENQHKIFKAIKKAKRLDKYEAVVQRIFAEY